MIIPLLKGQGYGYTYSDFIKSDDAASSELRGMSPEIAEALLRSSVRVQDWTLPSTQASACFS